MAFNNELINLASIKEHIKEFILDVENLAPPAEICIYKVPNKLRKMNEEAYTPQVVSIGPFHYDCNQGMKKQKIIFVREFRNRIGEETWQVIEAFIKDNVEGISKCYAEITDSAYWSAYLNFTEMILYDAVFIIEYIRRYPNVESDILMKSLRPVKFSIWTDLLLLENQLPYFVLDGVYRSAFGNQCRPFFFLAYGFVCPDMPKLKQGDEVEVKHFTDMRRYFVTKMHYGGQQLRGNERDLPCVSKLQESGVTFKRFEKAECFIQMRVQKKKWLRIPHSNFPELQIPEIRIYDNTETVIRNMMALEQCHYRNETHVCNYVYLMDSMIDSEEDVNLLIEAGIISNRVGDSAEIAKMFNRLGRYITFSGSPYYTVVRELKEYYKNRRNHAKATLKRVYFSNPWKGTGTVAAAVLLLLTLIQAICAIVKP